MGPSELPPLTVGTVGCWNTSDKAKVERERERERGGERDRERQADRERTRQYFTTQGKRFKHKSAFYKSVPDDKH